MSKPRRNDGLGRDALPYALGLQENASSLQSLEWSLTIDPTPGNITNIQLLISKYSRRTEILRDAWYRIRPRDTQQQKPELLGPLEGGSRRAPTTLFTVMEYSGKDEGEIFARFILCVEAKKRRLEEAMSLVSGPNKFLATIRRPERFQAAMRGVKHGNLFE
jgi:hypothetical protein